MDVDDKVDTVEDVVVDDEVCVVDGLMVVETPSDELDVVVEALDEAESLVPT